MLFDGEAFGQQMVAIVRDFLAAEVEPLQSENKSLLERVAALEAREPVAPEKGNPGIDGRDGTDCDMDAVAALVDAVVTAKVTEIPVPRDGKSVEIAEVKALVDEAVAALPPGKDGADCDMDAVKSFIAEEVAVAVSTLPLAEKGEPGRDVDMADVGLRIETAVRAAVGALPAPKDGEPGKDGLGLADALIDREGALVLTMTDGRMKSLGHVVGQSGDPGVDGRDGRDIEDIVVTQEGAVVEFAFQLGDTRTIYEVELPAGPPGADGKDAYSGEAKGLFDPSAIYRALDVVSHNGSEWRAKQDHPGELPGPGWMLSACKGKRGDRGERGQAGKDGISPVAQYLRGSELVMTLSDGGELKADLSDLRDGEVNPQPHMKG